MAEVRLENVSKNFGKVTAVRDANFVVKDKSFVVMVGPSGCGKSTTLRMVAGLEEINEGEIYIDGRLVNDVHPKDRDVAMVFQSYALYPHMNVYENISFGLRMRRFKRDEIDRRVLKAAEILGIKDLLKRKPAELSGGQKQRVALGRAIVRNPKVFLFDEPLSNLDAKFRVQLRSEIKRLHQSLEATTIYVTHDQVEAMTLGDKIVVMENGVIQQIGTPDQVFHHPRNRFVGGFIGSSGMNFFDGVLAEAGGGIVCEISGVVFQLPRPVAGRLASDSGRRIIVGVRPPDMIVYEGETSEPYLSLKLNLIELLGGYGLLYMQHGDGEIAAHCEEGFKAPIGDDIHIGIDMEKAHFFDADTEGNIFPDG
jgi:multiple sugar transport system ATP-binding protein